MDWKRGRFSIEFEVNEIDSALRGRQDEVGDTVTYYRFSAELSESDDIYDEGSGAGRVYLPPMPLPVLHVTREEGGNQDNPEGFYTNDEIHLTASFEQIVKVGLTALDVETDNYLRDRFVYDNRVFRVMKIAVLGQMQQRDIIVGMDATQVKPDELVNDPAFKKYSA
jgi:hypothetical protein